MFEKINVFVIIFIMTSHWPFTLSQIISLNPCQQYLNYERIGNELYGLITIEKVPSNNINLKLQFTQRTPIEDSLGGITLLDTNANFTKNINNDQQLTYRVDFPNNKDIPVLVRLVLNDEIICSKRDSLLLGTNYQLQHTFQQRNNECGPCQTISDSSLKIEETENNGQFNCGVADPNAFKYGGSLLEKGQVPWIATVYEILNTGFKFICGGSLINSRAVITTASCVVKHNNEKRQTAVTLGQNNIRDYSELVLKHIKTVYIHPEYPNSWSDQLVTLSNDIAILELQSPVAFNKFISPICLWNEPTDLKPFEGSVGFFGGWDEQSHTLAMVDMTIFSLDDCIRLFRFLSISNNNFKAFCAGNRDETGPCLGESGNALVINRNGRWTIRGILSLGIIKSGECDKSSGYAFNDVAYKINWIENILSKINEVKR